MNSQQLSVYDGSKKNILYACNFANAKGVESGRVLFAELIGSAFEKLSSAPACMVDFRSLSVQLVPELLKLLETFNPIYFGNHTNIF